MSEPDWLKQARANGLEITEGRPVNTDALNAASAKALGEALGVAETEAAFQDRVIAYARSRGWLVAHFRPARCVRPDGTVYYVTPVQADGAGFPDLVLVRGTKAKDRVLFVELKSDKGVLRPEQAAWLKALDLAGAAALIWRPSDWSVIEEVLR